jgi:hypothetical protein
MAEKMKDGEVDGLEEHEAMISGAQTWVSCAMYVSRMIGA